MESIEYQRIELLAYYIYLAEGRPEGRALQHWLEAEYQVATHTLGDKSDANQNNHNGIPEFSITHISDISN